jgi:hypothetical protein
MVKHGQQKRMIRMIDQYGQFKSSEAKDEIEGRTASFGYKPYVD